MEVLPLITTEKSITKMYSIEKLLGQGQFAKVYVATDSDTKKPVAVKKIANIPTWSAEDEILRKLDHPNIVKFRAVHKTTDHTYLITEFIKGKELRDVILDNTKLDELYAKQVFGQIVNAIEYLHSEGYAHRDIKVENVVVSLDTEEVKVIDFGFAMRENNANIRSGSPEYASPELLMSSSFNYKPTDVWAMGVVLYLMLYGKYPFDSNISILSNRAKDVYNKIIKSVPKYDNSVSDEANALIMDMLQKDPKKRPTVSELKNYSWLA